MALYQELMQRRFSVDRNKQEHLEDEFMNYIDSAFYPHPVHPYTLLRGCLLYTSSIMEYRSCQRHLSGLRSMMLKNEIALTYRRARYGEEDIITSVATAEYTRKTQKNTYTCLLYTSTTYLLSLRVTEHSIQQI